MEFRSSHEKLAYLCLTVKDVKDNGGEKDGTNHWSLLL